MEIPRISPLENIRVAIGIFRWKMEKEGYETVLAASSTYDHDISGRNPLIPYNIFQSAAQEGKRLAGPGGGDGSENRHRGIE